MSTQLRPSWTEPIGLLYIDGKHDYWTLSDDLRWTEFLPGGAPVLIHDAYSSIGVTLGLLRHALPAGGCATCDRAGSLARFQIAPASAADRLRMLAEMPVVAAQRGCQGAAAAAAAPAGAGCSGTTTGPTRTERAGSC